MTEGASNGSGAHGEIVVRLVEEGLIECRGFGALRREHMLAAHAESERLLEMHPGKFDWLCDGLAIESFEAGMPMLAVRWSLPRIGRFGRMAVVGRAGPMLSVATTFQYLLPGLPIGLFTDRSKALLFLNRAALAYAGRRNRR